MAINGTAAARPIAAAADLRLQLLLVEVAASSARPPAVTDCRVDRQSVYACDTTEERRCVAAMFC